MSRKNQYTVNLELHDYRIRQIYEDKVMSDAELKGVMGDLIRVCGEARGSDADGYVFKGYYQSAGGDMLPMAYHLWFERIQENGQ